MTTNEVERCPDCDSADIREVVRDQQFEYGTGEKAVVLTATMPVFQCAGCGYQYTDERADIARHVAVCRYEGRFIPQEIVEVRNRNGLSRAEFAALGKYGPASVARWENGVLLHNASNDQLMYLFQFPPIVELLKNRQQATLLSTETTREQFWNAIEETEFWSPIAGQPRPRGRKVFRALQEDTKLHVAATSWRLRRASAGT